MSDPSTDKETALIIHPVLPQAGKERRYIPPLEQQLEEAEGLAHAIFLDITEVKTVRVDKPSSGHLIGKGNREDIAALIKESKPSIVIVNHILSPVQQRNLEKEWHAKVIDRTGLILEIFGARAQTREGQIQVELAALEYQRSRLVRSWTHLERQRGGAGFMGGPGETQIEIDRRLIGERITRLKKDLEQVRKNRDLQRQSRERVPFPIVALVGYTNAGKSTLFNRMTGAKVFAKDLLFATLDPTMRKVTLQNGQDIILSDTVGFISDLPTHLVAAFRATLEQVQYADVILHVRDISSPDHESQKEDVMTIMEELGIDYETDDRIIEVLNKIDMLAEDDHGDILRQAKFNDNAVALSALSGEGEGELLKTIEGILSRQHKSVSFALKTEDGEALAWLYEHAHISERIDDTDRITATVDIDPANLGRFIERFGYDPLPQDSDNQKQAHGN